MQRLKRAGAVLAGFTLLAALSACGEDSGGDGKNTEPVTIDITIKDGTVDPNGDRVKVGVGQPIDLVVTADEPGELHMHSDPEQSFAYDAGTETFKIEIDRPGVIAVESHALDKTIVQLEVRQ